ncbi:MAG: type II toxin-antitoxin system VapC family toxin [Isosphaeraceae bacterium]
MASSYFVDSSALVKRYVQETGTSWVRGITRSSPSTVIYIARITAVEVTCAVARRRKGKTLKPRRASSILHRFRQHLAGRYIVIEVTPALLDDAMRLGNTPRSAHTTPCNSPWRSKSTAAIRRQAPAPSPSFPPIKPSTTPPRPKG